MKEKRGLRDCPQGFDFDFHAPFHPKQDSLVIFAGTCAGARLREFPQKPQKFASGEMVREKQSQKQNQKQNPGGNPLSPLFSFNN
ncbi:MAG: hypothetical protein HQL76_16315 [Magnetococcales bacterium]|nr:hypothetical protein [Magnetococcales bacterium]